MTGMPYYFEINTWMFIITGFFYYFSTILNPILYTFMSEKMRETMKEIFLHKKNVTKLKSKVIYKPKPRNGDSQIFIGIVER